jgi:hypothetical protein
MFNYEIESYNLRTRTNTSHGSWIEDDEIPDSHRSQQLWSHARPSRPAIMWIQGDDDPDRVPLHIVGYGDDPKTLADMVARNTPWTPEYI